MVAVRLRSTDDGTPGQDTSVVNVLLAVTLM
jgi:hypothetical protein